MSTKRGKIQIRDILGKAITTTDGSYIDVDARNLVKEGITLTNFSGGVKEQIVLFPEFTPQEQKIFNALESDMQIVTIGDVDGTNAIITGEEENPVHHGTIFAEYKRDGKGRRITSGGVPQIETDENGTPKVGVLLGTWDANAITLSVQTGVDGNGDPTYEQRTYGAWVAAGGGGGETANMVPHSHLTNSEGYPAPLTGEL